VFSLHQHPVFSSSFFWHAIRRIVLF
jgi:hypothetical protein